jgi:hypothetical protein
MTNQFLKTIYISVATLLITSCSIPKETLIKVQNNEKQIIDFPIEYCNNLPTPTFEKGKWDEDYDKYNKYLTKNIMRTQLGLSYTVDSVKTWWCMPSVRTHVQLDTTTMISDTQKLLGEWRAVCNRRITYQDSCSYADSKIYRTSNIDQNNEEEDVVLVITDSKFKLYQKEKGNSEYKSLIRNYHLESKRYLMLYKSSLATSAVSFAGIDKDGRLILNSYFVEERKKENKKERKYLVFQATMTQLIFEKLK